MSLRRTALLIILLTGVLAIAGEWSARLAGAWRAPAVLLLAGLACEGALVARSRIALRLTAAPRWPLGRPREIGCAVRQDSFASLQVQVLLDAPDAFAAVPRVETLSLARGLESRASLGAAARRLGRYAWPPPKLRIGGPLHLAWWPRRAVTDCSVEVVPDLVERAEWAAGSATVGRERGQRPGSGSEILELRDYRREDPLRLIDWKASARRARLVSREMSQDQHLELIVAIDAGRASGLGAGETDRLGLYVNVAARFAERAAMLDDAVGVLIFAARPLARLAPARGAAAVIRARRLLAACRVQASESNPVLAAAAIRGMAHRRSLVVLLTDLEDASAGGPLLEAVRLLTPKHLALVAGFTSARIDALASATVDQPLGAYRALAAIEYGATIEGNVRALRALGAATVTARPEHLDRAVFDAYRSLRARRMI